MPKQRSNLIELMVSRKTQRERGVGKRERGRERVSYQFYYTEWVYFVFVKKVYNSISVETDRCDIVSGSYCEEKKGREKVLNLSSSLKRENFSLLYSYNF